MKQLLIIPLVAVGITATSISCTKAVPTQPGNIAEEKTTTATLQRLQK